MVWQHQPLHELSVGGTKAQDEIIPKALDELEQQIDGLADDVKSKQCFLSKMSITNLYAIDKFVR